MGDACTLRRGPQAAVKQQRHRSLNSVLYRRWRPTPMVTSEPPVSKVNLHPSTCPLRGVHSRECAIQIGVDRPAVTPMKPNGLRLDDLVGRASWT